MADQTILREFLVKLGFDVEQKGFKDWNDSIDQSTKRVGLFVAAIGAAALSVGAGVVLLGNNLERLYFASQRTGASISSLKALEVAGRNLGVSAEESRAAVEGLAKYMRDNPVGEEVVKGLGVDTRDANGNLRDTVDILTDMGKALRGMEWWEARVRTSDFGISDNTLAAIRSGDFSRQVDEARHRLSRIDFEKSGQQAHEFMTRVRDLGVSFETLGYKVNGALMERALPSLEKLSAWMDEHGDEIAKQIAEVVEEFLPMGRSVADGLGKLLEFLVRLDKATDGWSTKLIVMLGLLRLLGLGGLVTGVLRLAAGFFSLATGIGAARTAAVGAAASGAAAGGLGALLRRFLGPLYLMLHSEDLNDGEDADLARRRATGRIELGDGSGSSGAAAPPSQGAATAKSPAERKRTALAYFQAMGWRLEQAAGIVANLFQESGLLPYKVGDNGKAVGVAQWHPDRQAEFKRLTGKDLATASIEDQLWYVNHELTAGAEWRAGALLRATNNARQAGEIVSRKYERPGTTQAAMDREARVRGAASATIANEVTINVSGAGDPAQVARDVAAQQERVLQEVTRLTEGVAS